MIKKNIPNLFTSANLFSGCLGIVFAFQGNLVWTAYMVGIAAVMDFLDGFVARLLKVHSEIGKQLDSLADMVTFGVVPGVVMFHLLQQSFYYGLFLEYWEGKSPENFNSVWYDTNRIDLIPYLGFIITVFSAIRLAKFNIDTRQSDSFIGVPTPANSILICSIPLILYFGDEAGRYFMQTQVFNFSMEKNPLDIWETLKAKTPGFLSWQSRLLFNRNFLVVLTLIMSYLLVAELPLFALKFKNFGWADNKLRFIFLGLSLAMLIIFQYLGIPFIIVLYVLLSLVNNMIRKNPTKY